ICGIESPRVGLLSIGEEDTKGTSTVKEARKLMRDEPQINFIGNVEGRDLFKGAVDVVVCDGFVGNIILKFTEGIAEGLFQTIMAELSEYAPELLEDFKPVMKKIYHKHDWQEYGGAPGSRSGGSPGRRIRRRRWERRRRGARSKRRGSNPRTSSSSSSRPSRRRWFFRPPRVSSARSWGFPACRRSTCRRRAAGSFT